MTNAVNNNSKLSLNKIIAIGVSVYTLIEAVIAYFVVYSPLFIKPLYASAERYREMGKECTITLFKNSFAVADANSIVLSLSGTLLNIILLILALSGSVILLSFFFFKGYAFAKSYLIAVFGAKAVIGLSAVMVPLTNLKNVMRIFGVATGVISLFLCGLFVYLNAVEYADDMLYTDEQKAAMKKRGIFGGVMFVILAAAMVFESRSVYSLGGNWSKLLGWTNDTGIVQGIVPALLIAVGLIAACTYVIEGDWAEYFFFSFGAAAAISDIVALINKFRLNPGFGTSTVFLCLALAASAVIAVLAFTKIMKRGLFTKPDAANKKAYIAVLITAGSIVLSFALTIAANLLLDRQLYPGVAMGAMDIMYLIVYGGATLFLASALLGGNSFTKFGTLALYILVAPNAFENIFVAFAKRSAFVAANPGLHGYNYIIIGVLYILAFVSCFGIIASFIVKDVDSYLYSKRYS